MPTLLFVMCHVAGLSVPRMSETQYRLFVFRPRESSQLTSPKDLNERCGVPFSKFFILKISPGPPEAGAGFKNHF